MKAFCILLFLALNGMVFAKSTRNGANNGSPSSDSNDLSIMGLFLKDVLSGLCPIIESLLQLVLNALGIPDLFNPIYTIFCS
ncbi:hypothetical protein ALC57_08477 [Trachymyrmex cornetzi]|uniref:Uncharacterized protein n=1 Tax=Trachymyrmex cornetzi TaxID=471704 RepID=A0A151J6X2_9HYME|nr:hypothetical protein ALC57_08477 [Trachymyrmex cornetzi]